MKKTATAIVLLLSLTILAFMISGCTYSEESNNSANTIVETTDNLPIDINNTIVVDSDFIQNMQSTLGTMGYKNSTPPIFDAAPYSINEDNTISLYEDESHTYYYTAFSDGIDTCYLITIEKDGVYYVFGFAYFDKIHPIDEVTDRIKVKDTVSESNEDLFVNNISNTLISEDGYRFDWTLKPIVTDQGVYFVQEKDGRYVSFHHTDSPVVNALIYTVLDDTEESDVDFEYPYTYLNITESTSLLRVDSISFNDIDYVFRHF